MCSSYNYVQCERNALSVVASKDMICGVATAATMPGYTLSAYFENELSACRMEAQFVVKYKSTITTNQPWMGIRRSWYS